MATAVILTLAFAVVEALAGWWSGSLALFEHHAAEAHGGRVELRNRLEGGLEAILVLPRAVRSRDGRSTPSPSG